MVSNLNRAGRVTPEMTCAFSIANGEYIYGLGTCHSFPMNAAHHWGLNCERVGKDRMGDIVNALKDGKMVVEICEAYTITGSGSGHFIVLTGVTKDGYITIADCASRERTGKSVQRGNDCSSYRPATSRMEPFGSLGNERFEYGRTLEIWIAYGPNILLHYWQCQLRYLQTLTRRMLQIFHRLYPGMADMDIWKVEKCFGMAGAMIPSIRLENMCSLMKRVLSLDARNP